MGLPMQIGSTVKQLGYSYVLLLFILALMGVALAGVGSVWSKVAQREKELQLLFIGEQFRKAIQHYHEQGGEYPTQLEDMLLDTRQPTIQRYLREVYTDPMTSSKQWGEVKSPEGKIMGVFSQSAMMPIKRTGFSAANAAFENQAHYSDWKFVVSN